MLGIAGYWLVDLLLEGNQKDYNVSTYVVSLMSPCVPSMHPLPASVERVRAVLHTHGRMLAAAPRGECFNLIVLEEKEMGFNCASCNSSEFLSPFFFRLLKPRETPQTFQPPPPPPPPPPVP